ncbi:hypothetical protein G9464_07055 [Halostella sp. JP-L12]|uniref:hypothetical protein n=1 Tax=Halostella TaxID=1843185 RepID=UPI0013CEBF05|nr:MULTISPECIES: hypothetical protein [Halostella]NHN47352.1 hypothetical protein [Halostella sp. JP-L12]
MERFVQFVVAGGVALVAGLWAVSLSAWPATPSIAGAVLVLLGAGALAVGIAAEIEY